MRHILAWIATVEVIGLASLLLLRAFFRNRRDAFLFLEPILPRPTKVFKVRPGP